MSLLGRTLQSVAGRTARPMSRDKADTLLLLLACVLVLAPQAINQPLWVTGVSIALLIWRSWITFRGNRMPPRWLLLPIAVLAMAGVYVTFKTFFGRDAGVAMLVLLLTFKLLEMRANRDLFVVVFLNFFLMLTNFFYSQGIGTAALTVAAVIVMLTAQSSFQYTGAMPSFGKRLKSGALIFALAAPLTIALFVLFPRIQGPLWGMPSDANAGRTGLSDTMSPGNISKLAQSNDVAFRVRFIDPVPQNAKLYWRGIVLDHYDGRTWTRQPSRRIGNESITLMTRGHPVRYQVTQEANSQPWLFALELPQAVPQLPDNPTSVTPDMQLVSARRIDERVRYDVTSFPDYDLQPDLDRSKMQQWLTLPGGFNPQTLAFADRIGRNSRDDLAAINSVLSFFHNQKFSYTLQPPLLGRNGIDEFLFSTRAGFCEHYAGAFVFLMRAMNIPARVVTGYQGGQINPVDGFMTVRQSDAHAWAEVWIEKRGWIRVDPTAAVAPERIERNAPAAAPAESVFDGLINVAVGRNSLLAQLRFRWDAINNGWNQWVLNYTPEKQKSLLRSLGFDNIDWQTMILLATAIGMMITLAMAIPLLSNRRTIDPLDAAYQALSKQMARRGYARDLHEGPRSYCRRLLGAASLSREQKHAIRQFLVLYEAARYGATDKAARAETLFKLKTLLNQTR
jgi:transglutaminase-like putative cysteine protease